MPLLIIISVLYLVLIIVLIIGFNKVLTFKETKREPFHKFSIIIPFRDEMDNIPFLAQSLEALHYPTTHFEVLWINDNSTDDSELVLSKYLNKNNNWRMIHSVRKTTSPKKDAINTAINLARFSWILTTDADCEVSKLWLNSYNSFLKDNESLKMIAGPVIYRTDDSLLHNFQSLDFLSLIGTTIGSFGINKPFMCNGANLCYQKDAFNSVNGFVGNDSIASGDDVFLLEKMLTYYPNNVNYIKSIDALVVTKPENSFKELINQRIRWASKTTATNNWFAKTIGILVFLMNLIVVFTIASLRDISELYKPLYLIFAFKLLIDLLLLYKVHLFFKLNLNLKFYLISFFIYPVFVVFIVVSSFFKKYHWKGRIFDK
ncbi:MAG: glycosyltransferase [Flavobacteriaceae bacterium]